MIAAAALLAALAAPDSLAIARAEGEAFAMLARMWNATRATVVAIDRVRPVGGTERWITRDSVVTDEAWATRLRAALQTLPPSECPRVPLVPGQTYSYLFVITPQMPGEPSAIELDFRGPCVRFVRGQSVVASRSIRGREHAFVGLLAAALQHDRTLARLLERHPPDTARAVSVAGLERPPAAPVDPDAGPRPLPSAFVPVDQMAAVVSQQAPSYPEEARRRGAQGVVFVRALVGRSGRVLDANVEKSVMWLDQAAIEAVLAWRFKPAMREGQPVMTWITVPVRFSLH